VKPAAFDYLVVHTPQEAVSALAENPEETRILAGGQSLVLDMNYRRERPARLVDINGVAELDRLEVSDKTMRVGALVRHRSFEEPVVAGPLGRLLSRVSHYIAHPPIRARGTMIGSLAYAHPAAEWPAVAVALDAELTLSGPEGERTVPAAGFFHGPFATARRPQELLTEARLPLLDENSGVGFAEQRRTQASFAMAAAVATVTVDEGKVVSARIALANAADRPLRARRAEEFLLDRPPGTEVFAEAGRRAAQEADPRPEPHAGVAYRRQTIKVLVHRALQQALTEITERA
jgi:aerobic carbon-monoxide dehydrogenase medium subunit